MSYSWGPDPDPNARPKLPPEPPDRGPLRARLARIDLGRPHYVIGRAFWWLTTVVAGAFGVLSVAAGNGFGALQWGTLAALGLVAQDVLRLDREIDRMVNPRRVDLPARPAMLASSTVRMDSRHATPQRRFPEAPMTLTSDVRSPMSQ